MKTTFLLSAARVDQLPALGIPEIAFVGRSNVGKSSLLNALVNAKIARTSSTPGRTQHVNLFRVHAGFGDFGLADLPGYGFAKAPKSVRNAWGPLTDRYLTQRGGLGAALLLLDSRRDPNADDLAAVDRLKATVGARGGVVQVVVTKLDKLPKSKRKPRIAQIARAVHVGPEQILGTSSQDRLGLDGLLERIKALVQPEPGDSA